MIFSLLSISLRMSIFCSFQVCKGNCCRKQHACRRSGKGWIMRTRKVSIHHPYVQIYTLKKSLKFLGEGIFPQTREQVVSMQEFSFCSRINIIWCLNIFVSKPECEIETRKGVDSSYNSVMRVRFPTTYFRWPQWLYSICSLSQ